jgi:hypothetical protein
MTADVIEWKTNDKIKTRNEVIGKFEKENIYGFVSRYYKIMEFYNCEGKRLIKYGDGFNTLAIGDIVYSESLDHYGYVFETSGYSARVEFHYITGGIRYVKLLTYNSLQKLECSNFNK